VANKVMVIIPTIGRASLKRAIISAQNQSEVDIEILVIDDSSQQNVKVPNGVKILRSGGSLGPGFSRNLALKEINSDFVAFLDDDDSWFSHKCIFQIEFMRQNSLDASYHKALLSNNEIRPKLVIDFKKNPLKMVYGLNNIFWRKYYLPMPSLMITKEVANSLEFPTETREREDLVYLHQIWSKGFKIVQIDQVLMNINSNRYRSISRVGWSQDIFWAKFLLKNVGIKTAFNFIFFYNLRNRLIKVISIVIMKLNINLIEISNDGNVQ
jgi:glycosyltransferase involved in cell wall biosynthesis